MSKFFKRFYLGIVLVFLYVPIRGQEPGQVGRLLPTLV